MNRFARLFGLLLVAALPLVHADAAWSAAADKPQVKKTVKKAKPAKHKKAVKRKVIRAAAPAAPVNPYLPAPQAVPVPPAPVPAAAIPAPAVAAAAAVAADTAKPAAKPAAKPEPAVQPFAYSPPFTPLRNAAAPNPYLVHAAPPVAVAAAPAVSIPALIPQLPAAPAASAAQPAGGNVFGGLRSLLPDMPPSDQAILPTIKKVYPTGEKPLVVLTFKCPTELIGVSPISTKALHGLVDGGFGLLNSSNLLSFNLQQVCQ